jgi:hypothetical protein
VETSAPGPSDGGTQSSQFRKESGLYLGTGVFDVEDL